jgi:2-keto-3-deoxy-L-rhamnonate aldolase RhmA
LTIDEIDAFIFGPNDLSGSMGKLGRFNDPDVRQVIDEAIQKINAAGKVAGLSLGASDEKTMRDWYARGIRMISAGYDVKYIMAGARANLAAMHSAFGTEK